MKELVIYKKDAWWVVRFNERPTNHLYIPVTAKKPYFDSTAIHVFDDGGTGTNISIKDFTSMDGDKLNEKYFLKSNSAEAERTGDK